MIRQAAILQQGTACDATDSLDIIEHTRAQKKYDKQHIERSCIRRIETHEHDNDVTGSELFS